MRRVESDQQKQGQKDIAGERPTTKETKSQRKQRKRLERQAEQAELQREAHERAQRRRNPKKERKQAKPHHRATRKEEKQRLKKLRQQRLTEPAQPQLVSSALEGSVQRWFVSGEGYKDPSVFLDHTDKGVIKIIDSVNGPRKVYTTLKCVLKKTDIKRVQRPILILLEGAKPTPSP